MNTHTFSRTTYIFAAYTRRVFIALVLSVLLVGSGVFAVITALTASAAVGDYQNWQSVTDGKLPADVPHNASGIVSSADGTKLAASSYQHIYTSADSGATWITQQTIAGTNNWRSVTSSADGTKLAVIADDVHSARYIHTSTDSGATWTAQSTAGPRDWAFVTSSADGTKLAAAVYNGSIYTSADSGATWTERTAAGSRQWHVATSSGDGTKLAAAAYGGYIYTSTDSGATWTEQTSAGARVWSSITSSADGAKLAAATYNNYIYTSTDSGQTWTEQTSAGSHYWKSITSSSDGNLLAAMSGDWNGSNRIGSIYLSTDSGQTWTEQTSAGERVWSFITSSADGTKLAAASDFIYTSTDSGQTWSKQIAGVRYTKEWSAITSSADGTKLAAAASGGYIYTSTDSGATWTEQTSAGARVWSSITSSADGAKLAATSYGIDGSIYTSTDSGATWIERTDGLFYSGSNYRQWTSITSSADGTKLAATELYRSIYTSTDSGQTWTEQTSVGELEWNSITSSADGTKLAAIGNTCDDECFSSIYTSTDSGATWIERVPSGDASYLVSMASSTDGTKLAVTGEIYDEHEDESYVTIYTSTDSGATWIQRALSTPPTESRVGVNDIAMSGDGNKLAVSMSFLDEDWMEDGGSVYTSIDSGTTWAEQIASTVDDGLFSSVVLSADGTKLATAIYGGDIYTATVQQPTLSFNPDGSSAIPPASTSSSSPQVITNTKPTFAGIAYANGPVTVTVNSDPIVCSTTADTSGNWSCTLPSDIPAGTHTITVQLTNPLTDETETLGPYYVQVLGDGTTTIDDNTPLAPNTGFAMTAGGAAQFIQLSGGLLMILGGGILSVLGLRGQGKRNSVTNKRL